MNLVGVSLPLPLFDRNQGNVLSASRRADQARDLRNATELRLRGDVAMALEQWRRAQAAIDAHDQQHPAAAQQAVDSATRGFRMGKLAFLDVLDAQRTLIDARKPLPAGHGRGHRGLGQPGAPLRATCRASTATA